MPHIGKIGNVINANLLISADCNLTNLPVKYKHGYFIVDIESYRRYLHVHLWDEGDE